MPTCSSVGRHISACRETRCADLATHWSDHRVTDARKYLAPEQLLGQPVLDGKTDVYALATLAYRLVGGVLPLESGSADRHREAPSFTPSQPLPATVGAPSSLQGGMNRAFAKNPAARPSMSESARILGRFTTPVPMKRTHRKVQSSLQRERFRSRHRNGLSENLRRGIEDQRASKPNREAAATARSTTNRSIRQAESCATHWYRLNDRCLCCRAHRNWTACGCEGASAFIGK